MAFGGPTRAERDLRDAFRAIKLMRADLEQTRAEKRQLEAAAALWSQRETAAREAASMREEDFQAQLQRVASAYEAQLAISRIMNKSEKCHASLVVKEKHESGGSNQFDNDDDQPAVMENGKDRKEDENACDSNCRELKQERLMALWTDEAAREKLQRQAETRRLCAELEEYRSSMTRARIEFEEAKADLELSLEESERESADKSARIEELTREKQLVEEKYEFLVTELDVLKQDRRELKEQLTSANNTKLELQQTLDDVRATHQLEVISIQNMHQTTRAQLDGEIVDLKTRLGSSASTNDAGLVDQIQHELLDMGEQLECRDSEIAKLRDEVARMQEALHSTQESHGSAVAELQTKLEAFSQTSMILKGQLVDKEEEAASSRVRLREHEEALRVSRAECDDLRDTLQSECDAREALQSILDRRENEAAVAYSSLQYTVQEQETQLSELNDEKNELEAGLEAVKLTSEHLAQELEGAKQELRLAQDEASARRDGLTQSRSRCNELEQELRAASAHLEKVLSDQRQAVRAAEDLKLQLELQLEEAHAANVALSGQLSEALAQLSVLEQECKKLSMEKKALQQEVRQLKEAAAHVKDELADLQSRSGDLEQHLQLSQRQGEAVRAQLRVAGRHLEAFESKAMAAEDRRQLNASDELDALHVLGGDGSAVAKPSAAWSVVSLKIAELGKFLPHMQSFAVFLDDALCACESNATALSVLCAQLEQSDSRDASTSAQWRPSLLHEVVAFVGFASQLQRLVLSRQPEFVKHARRFHHRVFEVMARWHEVTGDDEIPAPPVAIASREVALILANWTRDKAKRVVTRQWLEQVEAVGGAGLGTYASEVLSPRLDADGTTLVLDDMSSEVKQAFLVLVVPILRRNPAVFVRVFTRLVSPPRESTRTTIAMLEDKRWEMKIHVQPSTRPASTTGASYSMSATSQSLETASTSGLDHSPASPSSVSSSSTTSSATSLASARLQIIQERLQRMQSR